MDEFEARQERQDYEDDRWERLIDAIESLNEKLDRVVREQQDAYWQHEREMQRQEQERLEKLPCTCADSKSEMLKDAMAEHNADPLTRLTGYYKERVITCERHGSHVFQHFIPPTAQLPSDHTRAFGPLPMAWEDNHSNPKCTPG